MGDAKWAAAYDKEYQTQYKRLKGQSVMGLGEFHESAVKKAALDQMRQGAVYQNAINWMNQSEGKRADVEDVIAGAYCVPNCVRK